MSKNDVIVKGYVGRVAKSVKLGRNWTKKSFSELPTTEQQHVFLCYASLPYFFHHVILHLKSPAEGYVKPAVLPPYQKYVLNRIQNMLEAKPNQALCTQLVIILPTGHMKTTMCCEAAPLWDVARDPTRTWVLCNASQDNARRYLVALKSHIEANDEFVRVFGDLYPKRKGRNASGETPHWSAVEATVTRPMARTGSTFSIAGLGSRVQGNRYDRCALDDIVDEDNARTEQRRDTVWNWWVGTISKRLDPNRRVVIDDGSRYHVDDFHGRVMLEAKSKGNWDIIDLPAIANLDSLAWPPAKPKGWARGDCLQAIDVIDFSPYVVLWPDFWPPEALYKDWIEDLVGAGKWWCMRQNMPLDPSRGMLSQVPDRYMCRADGNSMPDGTIFRTKPCLRCWSMQEGRTKGETDWARNGAVVDRVIVSIDLASGRGGRTKHRVDWMCIQVWCRLRDGRRALAWQFRTKAIRPSEFKQLMAEVVNNFRPDAVRCETDMMQVFIADDLSEYLNFPISDSRLQSQAAEVEGDLQNLLRRGFILYAWDSTDSETMAMMHPFEDELSTYPGAKHDDTVKAAMHAQGAFGTASASISPIVASITSVEDMQGMTDIEGYGEYTNWATDATKQQKLELILARYERDPVRTVADAKAKLTRITNILQSLSQNPKVAGVAAQRAANIFGGVN